jgi:hypothetical protein
VIKDALIWWCGQSIHLESLFPESLAWMIIAQSTWLSVSLVVPCYLAWRGDQLMAFCFRTTCRLLAQRAGRHAR